MAIFYSDVIMNLVADEPIAVYTKAIIQKKVFYPKLRIY
jgi:hypothetical protein